MAADPCLTVVEVAKLLKIDKQTVYRKIWAGEIPAIDIARKGAKRARLRVRRSAVDAYMDERELGQVA